MIISGVDLSKMFSDLFNKFDELMPEYVLMNKYDEIPNSLPSDLDFCISQKHFENLDSIIVDIAKAVDLVIVQKIWHNYRKCAYILSPSIAKEKFRLQLDFFSDFSVRNTPYLIENTKILSSTRKYSRYTVPSYEMEFLFLNLRRIFKNDYDQEKCCPIVNDLEKDYNACLSEAVNYFGEKMGNDLCVLLKNGSIDDLCKFREQLWNRVRERSKKETSLSYKIKYWSNQILRHIYRIKYPVGMSIAFLSPDGGGKTTAIELVKDKSWGLFHGRETLYFRPRMLKNPGSYRIKNKHTEDTTNDNPHGKKKDGLVKSLIRFHYYNLDFIFGTILKIYPLKVKKNLVVFDRYYYDYYADMERYQYSLSSNYAKLWSWLIPKPDITFVLDAPSEVLYNRKPELSVEEIDRQRQEFNKLANGKAKIVRIDANQTAEKVAEDVTKVIINYKAKMVSKMLKVKIDETGHVL